MRIQKFIADCGVCSRRAAEQKILQGSVLVNGKPAQIGQTIDPEKDRVVCDKKRIHLKVCSKQYFMFYKPRGVITSMKAQDDRSIVADLIAGIKGRVYPVGRLDRDSEGLLLLTDDGEAAQKLMHPSHNIWKTYRVTVKGKPSAEVLDKLRQGVQIDEQTVTQPAQVEIHSQTEDKTVLHISIHEGKNRQIRRMCEQLGLEISLLKRIAFGPLHLGHMAPGAYRPLTDKERDELLRSIDIDPQTKIKPDRRPAHLHAAPKNNRYVTAKQKKASMKSVYERRFLKQFSSKKK